MADFIEWQQFEDLDLYIKDNDFFSTVRISRDKLFQLQIPLPPLAEQKKIVEIIEQMLLLCEKLGG